jgi:catechol 2,3-dioxygenase-like lactoylglutathione lyase family enzyme
VHSGSEARTAAGLSEVAIATAGVADLGRAQRFYSSCFGYRTLAHGPLPDAIGPSWRMAPGLRGHYALLGPPGAAVGLLRLVAFDAPGGQIWGGYERIEDHGHYALNLRVPNVHVTWPQMLAAGARPKSAPTRWNIDASMLAIDSQCWDPDGTLLDVYTMEGRPDIFGALDGPASALETVALHVADAERSRDFYLSLGYELFFDRRIAELNTFFHLPAGVALRDVNLAKPARSWIGRIEIVQLEGMRGVPVRERAAPPNHGILSITFEAADVQAARTLALRSGAMPCGDASSVDWGPEGGGARKSCTVYGPDGELIEFAEPWARTGGAR